MKLTIDGKQVDAPAGATILDAARKLGIDIPTLCHVDGIEPFASCFMCVVEVEGRRTLTPSCICPAEEGMVVRTDTEEIREARKMALELLFSDHRGDCIAPCSVACPAGLDIPGFIRHIIAGRSRKSLALIKERIPLPGALGRVCPRFCERVCRRRERDEAIAICALKRFPADQEPDDDPFVPVKRKPTGKRVAIVGAGPAGLSATYDLLEQGHACTLFDANDEPGGLFRYGIPEFRLPNAALDRDIEAIRRLGAEFRMRVRVGENVRMDDLRSDYDAVLVAVGAQREQAFEFEGADLATSALAFLRKPGGVAGDVVVVGDGEEAVDAARTAVRLGAASVALVTEKPRKSMSCFEEWIDAAEAEGVRLLTETPPKKLTKAGDAYQLDCEDRAAITASLVITAPTRTVDLGLVEQLGLAAAKAGIAANAKTLATQTEGVFACGECVSGPTAGVRAVAAGRLAAHSIGQYLRGEELTGEPRRLNVRLGKLEETEQTKLFADFPKAPRNAGETLPAEQARQGFGEIERGLSPEAAIAEAKRCLQCDCAARDDCKLRAYGEEYGVRTSRFKGEARPFERDTSHPQVVYESGKCILCGLCVRAAGQAGEELGMAFSQRGFVTRTRVPFGRAIQEGLTHAAERCVEVCPTGALSLKRSLAPSSLR